MNHKQRKQRPLYSGLMRYFPDALMEVAHLSYIGNEQHNKGEPLHWAREKSDDHLDCMARHLLEAEEVDSDGVLHLTKAVWRGLAKLQLIKEKEKNKVKHWDKQVFDALKSLQDH